MSFRPIRVFVGADYFGAGNFGDDLSLTGFLSVAPSSSELEITACTAHDIASQRARFPTIRWLADQPLERTNAIAQADAWVLLGDTPFQLDSGPYMLDQLERDRARCASAAVPMYYVGAGCESDAAAADPRARLLLAAAEHVWTRDARSTAALRPFVPPERLDTGADLAHLAFADRNARPDPEPGVDGLLLAFERREQFDLGALERFVTARPTGTIRWLVQEVRPLPFVEQWILAALGADVRARLAVARCDYATCSVDEYLRTFGAPGRVVTSRYHGALTAAWLGAPVTVVARSGKLAGIADELDLPVLGGIGSAAVLEEALAAARAVRADTLRESADRARSMCAALFERLAARGPRTVAGTPLAPDAMRSTIRAAIPHRLEAGATAGIRCSIANDGAATLVSAPPHPVQLCYRWFDARGEPFGAGTWVHTPLPVPLRPGAAVETTAVVDVPRTPGEYRLAISLLQEDVAWFDDIDASNGTAAIVRVEAEHRRSSNGA